MISSIIVAIRHNPRPDVRVVDGLPTSIHQTAIGMAGEIVKSPEGSDFFRDHAVTVIGRDGEVRFVVTPFASSTKELLAREGLPVLFPKKSAA